MWWWSCFKTGSDCEFGGSFSSNSLLDLPPLNFNATVVVVNFLVPTTIFYRPPLRFHASLRKCCVLSIVVVRLPASFHATGPLLRLRRLGSPVRRCFLFTFVVDSGAGTLHRIIILCREERPNSLFGQGVIILFEVKTCVSEHNVYAWFCRSCTW